MLYATNYSIFKIKSVCKNLRLKNVTGHLGVFREYFEADNSRLQVTCSKDVSEEELRSIFAQFGTFYVTCIQSEGCEVWASIEYVSCACTVTSYQYGDQ